jgi:hypothetical protein
MIDIACTSLGFKVLGRVGVEYLFLQVPCFPIVVVLGKFSQLPKRAIELEGHVETNSISTVSLVWLIGQLSGILAAKWPVRSATLRYSPISTAIWGGPIGPYFFILGPDFYFF